MFLKNSTNIRKKDKKSKESIKELRNFKYVCPHTPGGSKVGTTRPGLGASDLSGRVGIYPIIVYFANFSRSCLVPAWANATVALAFSPVPSIFNTSPMPKR